MLIILISVNFTLNNCSLKKVKISLKLHMQIKILWGMVLKKKVSLKRKRELNNSCEEEKFSLNWNTVD